MIDDQPKRNSFSQLLPSVRVVERQALRLDVSFASAERHPGITMREAGRLDPMRLLVAVPREEAVLVVRLWSTLTSNWLSSRFLIGLSR